MIVQLCRRVTALARMAEQFEAGPTGYPWKQREVRGPPARLPGTVVTAKCAQSPDPDRADNLGGFRGGAAEVVLLSGVTVIVKAAAVQDLRRDERAGCLVIVTPAQPLKGAPLRRAPGFRASTGRSA
jgi:hypothetical protein